MKRGADGKATFSEKLRSAAQRLRTFERLVWPEIGKKRIDGTKRSDIVRLRDKIEDTSGPVMADRSLAYLRVVLNWHASRDDDLVSPVVKKMSRTKPKQRAGKRVLADDEIRDIWTALDAGAKDIPECFARLQRCLFFAAVRRDEAARMSWSEIEQLTRDDFSGECWLSLRTKSRSSRLKVCAASPLRPTSAAVSSHHPRTVRMVTLLPPRAAAVPALCRTSATTRYASSRDMRAAQSS